MIIFNNQYQQESVNLSLNQKSSTESLGAIMGSLGTKRKPDGHPYKLSRIGKMHKIYKQPS